MNRLILAVLFSLAADVACARMYQWVETENGTTQLSGKPPAWYRSEEKGPRIFVFEKSRLIDDTGIEVSESVRDGLRQQAFLKAEEEREAAREKMLQAKRLKATLNQRDPLAVELEDFPSDTDTDSGADDLLRKSLPDPAELTAEDMRSLITAWERQQTDRARQILSAPAGE